MNLKRRAATPIEPPQLSNVSAANPQHVPSLEAQAAYVQQAWAGLHFDAQEAENASFEQLDVRNTSFQDANLPLLECADCRFDITDFANCSLNKAYLCRVEFIGCRLIGTKLTDADLADIRFVRCNARLMRCWTSLARTIRFEQCDLQEASFDGSDLSGAVFHKCNLSGADLRNAKLKGTDLRGSQIAGIKVHGKDLAGVIVDPTQALELIQLFGVQVQTEDL